MQYARWLILFLLNICCSVLCYLTNWLIVLFADNRGELHGIWHLWQTWDDSLDVSWFVKETVPECLRYDFDKHYDEGREATEWLKAHNRDKGCVIDKGVKFSLVERLQRYCCRVLWLYRNCGYGFAFYLFGTDCRASDLMQTNGTWYTLYSDGESWQLVGKWKVFEVMAGWKLAKESDKLTHSMIAGRVLIRA